MSDHLLLIDLAVRSFVYKGHYYLDPGSGSYIIQLLLAFLMGLLFTIGHYWKRIRASIKTGFLRRKDDPEKGNPADGE